MSFACPPDCGHCCTHLDRAPPPGDDEFRAMLREHGVYHCADGMRKGLSLSNAEAAALRARAKDRGLRANIHPRTWLLDGKRRAAVVLDWHLAHASCPFLERERCTVYEERPLVCRAYPVLLASPFSLAPECPKVPAPRAALSFELAARRAIDRAAAKLDAATERVMAAPGARFRAGLTTREAAARLKRYRIHTPEEYLSRALATSSTS